MAGSMIFSVWMTGKYFDHRSFQEYGFHFKSGWRRDFIFGLALGALLMVFIFLVELSAGWIHIDGFFQPTPPSFSFRLGILGGLFFFLCDGVYEELWIRGYLLHNLAEALNFKFLSPRIALSAAYVISSVIFGFLHAGNPSASTISSVSISAAGLFLGLGFLMTGDLAIPIGIHIAWNFFEGNVFGFPVSGISSTETIIHINQTGPLVWTGGAFGPEAGLIGLAAILLGCVLTLAWLRFHAGKVILQDRLAQFQPLTGGDLDPQENVSPDNYP
jgi:membrane protease YdiL (CAAX protease family)